MDRDMKSEYAIEQIDLTFLAKAFAEQFVRIRDEQNFYEKKSKVAT